jgi:hypothetical protein
MNNPTKSSDSFEILTTKETLERLKIGRTKLFQLMKKGTLTPGRHFFKNGRVLRFVWGIDLIEAIHDDPGEAFAQTEQRSETLKPYKDIAVGRSPMNMTY